MDFRRWRDADVVALSAAAQQKRCTQGDVALHLVSMRLHRFLAFLAIALFVALAVQCASTPAAPLPDAGAGDGAVDLCDLNAYTGNGKTCPYVSSRVCFKLCEAGGCRCVASGSGPVWNCVTDFSCQPDSSPLDDSSTDAGTDAIADAPSDG